METMSADTELHARTFNVSTRVNIEHHHINNQWKDVERGTSEWSHNETGKTDEAKQWAKESFRYDSFLADYQRKHPDMMRRLLELYRPDMELFGYRWDWDAASSSCGYASGTGDSNHCC